MGTYISFGDFCKICFKSKDFQGNSRVRTEEKFRHFFTEEQKTQFQKNPREIWNWICKNIQEEPAYEYEELLTTPAGTLRYQRASLESKKVLFVAICRTLGVPARLNPLDGEMQYYGENAFLECGKL